MAVTKILIYISCLCFAQDFVFCDDYKEIGNKITLTPRIRGKPEEILWKHNENKVLEYDGSEVVEYGSFRGRVVVDFETGELTIQKLNSQDSGQYQSDIVINGKVQSSSHTLTVLDALAEPQVSCELDETSNVKKLLCSVESQNQLSYEWSGPNINGHLGPELVVDKQEENLDSVYTCTVKNQVNSKSTDFTLEDCHTGREGSAVLVPVLIVTILLLILLIALAILLYTLYKRKKQKQARPSEPKNMDPENGQGQNLLSNVTTESVPGSSDAIATLPSHIRLHPQKESIADKKWYQDNEPEDLGETEKLLKETNSLQEQNLKQSPQSDVTETNQENTGKGDEGELKYEKNSENAFEAEGNTYSKPDETEKKSHKLSQSQEKEEKEKSQILKQESENGEKSPEHQNERPEEQKTEDNNEDNQTPGQTEEATDRQDTESVSPAVTEGNMDNKAEQGHENEKSQNDDGEQSSEQQNENLRNQKTEDTAETCNQPSVDQQMGGEAPSAQAESVSPTVTEGNMDNKAEQGHENEKSQNDDGEQSPEQQNEIPRNQKTEDTGNSENDMRTGEKERTEEKNHKRTDKPNTAETCNRPSVDQQVGGEGASAPAESASPAVTERNMDNEAEQGHENEKSQNDDGEQSSEQQNPRNQKTEDTANSENDMRTGEKERTEEKNHKRTDKPNTAETCNRPSVDQPVDGKAPSAPAVIYSPANLEKEPINSSVASSSQTDLYNYTGQDKEEERKCPGLDQDEKRKVVTNQEEKGGQEQMPEEKNHDPEISDEISRINFDKQDKQTDPDSIITVSQQQGHDDGLSKRDEAVPACPEKSDMTNKNQSFTPIDNNAKVMQNEGETEAK